MTTQEILNPVMPVPGDNADTATGAAFLTIDTDTSDDIANALSAVETSITALAVLLGTESTDAETGEVTVTPNEVAALAAVIYAYPIDTRVAAINNQTQTGNKITGPFEATCRYNGMVYQYIRDRQGNNKITRDEVTFHDINGLPVRSQMSTYETTKDGNAERCFEWIGLNAGRTGEAMARQAVVAHKPPKDDAKPTKPVKSDPALAELSSGVNAVLNQNAALIAALKVSNPDLAAIMEQAMAGTAN